MAGLDDRNNWDKSEIPNCPHRNENPYVSTLGRDLSPWEQLTGGIADYES